MARQSKTVKAKSKEDIFAEMHRQLRAFNSEIPAAPERMDPILRLMMQMYAHQLERIDRRVDRVWEVAAGSLIRSMCPESMRWPVPAYTVMRCEPSDPVVMVDPHNKFFYKERREGGQTFFFSSLRDEKLIAARVRKLFLRIDDAVLDMSPQTEEEMSSTSRMRSAMTTGNIYRVYVGIEYDGAPSELADARVFLKGNISVLKQLRWGYWYPGSHFGSFDDDCGFCPGLTTTLETMFANGGRYADWGGLRQSTELFRPLEDSFVMLPDVFTAAWELGPPDQELLAVVERDGGRLDEDERLYWLRIDLPEGGDKSRLQSQFELHFNCFIAVNKNELTLFKHTGGNRLVEVELPEDIANILEVTSVVDSSGREYIARHEVAGDVTHRYYTPEERGNRLVLWFDFSSQLELPPDSVTVNYAVTAGTAANAIEAGKITELYENHPGIDTAVNIISTGGAIPAKTEEQVLTEVAARLRNRDRSLNFSGIARWAQTFDPRIGKVVCENGIDRMAKGVRRCIVVRVTVPDDDVYSDDEANLLQTRLGAFLKARSPVNTHYRVEIVRV